MNNTSLIYKEYIGKENEILETSKWFKLYHHIIVSIIKKNKSEIYINEKLKKLQITYKYKNSQSLYERVDLNRIEKIYNDFITQLNLFESTSYSNFNNLENDKLILLNIIESYFEYIRSTLSNKKSRQFYKNSLYSFSLISPKSKEFKIIIKFLNNSINILSFLLFFSVVWLIVAVAYMSVLLKILSIISKLQLQVSSKILMYLNKNVSFITILIIYFLVILSLLTACFILGKIKRFIIIRLLPEKKIVYERDKSEKESTLSIISIVISIASLIISIIFNIY